MDKSEFGKRLKKARIARRMTQSELAGDKVTRNMISRIENGVSVPSIGTLEYLAGRLDVPISVLVPQDGDGETLTAAKARFSANEFDKVIEMLEPVAVHGFGKFEFYDEACALLAKSYLRARRRDRRHQRKTAPGKTLLRSCRRRRLFKQRRSRKGA